MDAERERITRENQRKLDAYNEKKETAEKKVRELNARFADWYYVISEEEYKKLRLGRSDLITVTETPMGEGDNIDDFRKLQEDGLKKDGGSGVNSKPFGGLQGFPKP